MMISAYAQSGSTYTAIVGTPTVGQWAQVGFVYNGTTLSGIFNGALVNSTAMPSLSSSTNPFYIGDADTGGVNFDGLIGDVHIYNRVLSAAQIAAMYNGGK